MRLWPFYTSWLSALLLAGACGASAAEPVEPASEVVTAGGAAPESGAMAAEPEAPPPAEEPPAPPPAPRVTVAASGDLLLHIKVVKAGQDRGWDRVFQGLREASVEEEITFANLETPLVDDLLEVRTGSPPILGAPGEAAGALARAGVDVLGAANNHAYDQTSLGLARTVERVRAAGIVAVGGDRERERAYAPEVVERNGVRVAFLSYTRRINRGPGQRPPQGFVATLDDEARLEAAVAAARAAADVVVMGMHWSSDYVVEPTAWQRDLARRLVDMGVDVILGTGPHLLQEVERLESPRGDAVVAYSLGNLVSNQGLLYRPGRRQPTGAHRALTTPGTRDGVLLRVPIEPATEEEPRIRIGQLVGTPLWTENNFYAREARETREFDIWVNRLAATDDVTRDERLATIRAALGPAVEVAP